MNGATVSELGWVAEEWLWLWENAAVGVSGEPLSGLSPRAGNTVPAEMSRKPARIDLDGGEWSGEEDEEEGQG